MSNNHPLTQKKWGDLPPSIVAAPAVVVEGTYDGITWAEIPFRYTPGKPTRQPRRTAPHQPRLDWQMWFAALGSWQHNLWFIHLLIKVLQGVGGPAVELLDTAEYPFHDKPPWAVRAHLYHYDFTRLNSAWARNIHGARIINVTQGSSTRSEWWHRTKAKEYMPAINLENLMDVVRNHHWPTELVKAAECGKVDGMLGMWCAFTEKSRAAVSGWPVGWTFQNDILQSVFWKGASDYFFLDANLVLIVCPLLGLYFFKVLVRCLVGCICCKSRRSEPAPQGKRSSGKKIKTA